jgi:hypothetical protein
MSVSDSMSAKRSDSRMLLWRTLPTESSVARRQHAQAGDTLQYPLYGIIVPDSGKMTARRIAALKAQVDPIYPELLMYSGIGETRAREGHRELWMRDGLDGPGRDSHYTNGEGFHTDFIIYSIDRDGFRGIVARYPARDTSYFCAVRVQRLRQR